MCIASRSFCLRAGLEFFSVSFSKVYNFALNGTQGEVGVSLKKKKKKKKIFFFFFFFKKTHFHSVTTQMQAMVKLSDNLLPLHRVSPSIKWQ